MKKKVVSYKVYAAWEYEKEEQDLNEASKKGLQLIKGGCFHSEFRKDDSVRYIYQLDYNTKIQDPIRYRELFEEQGWEYINSTFNGWHYFRKAYEEGMPEDEARIYTDKESLYEMQNRWIKLLKSFVWLYAIMTIVYLAMGSMYHSNMLIIESVAFIIFGITLGLGVRDIQRKRDKKEGGLTLPLRWIFPVTLIFLVGALFFGEHSSTAVYQENFQYINIAEDKLPRSSSEFTINKSGNYYLDLDFSMKQGMMMISIQDATGEVVYENTADHCEVNDWRLELEPNTYKAYYSYQLDSTSSGIEEVKMDLKLMK